MHHQLKRAIKKAVSTGLITQAQATNITEYLKELGSYKKTEDKTQFILSNIKRKRR